MTSKDEQSKTFHRSNTVDDAGNELYHQFKTHFMRRARRHSVADPFDIQEEVPIPEVPVMGARVKVCYAGACYTKPQACGLRLRMAGVRDTSLFPGYEVSGVIDDLDPDVEADGVWHKGDRVVVFPSEETINSVDLCEYITVHDMFNLVKVPPSVRLEIAAMMPSGAMTAYNAILVAEEYVEELLPQRNRPICILIVGAGGLALMTLAVGKALLQYDANRRSRRDDIHIVVADASDEKLFDAEQMGSFRTIYWGDSLYEDYIQQRTLDACPDGVDIAIDFVSSSRTTRRVMEVLNEGGMVIQRGFLECDVLDSPLQAALQARHQRIVGVPRGSPEHLHTLIDLLATNVLIPPPYTVYPVDRASDVFNRLCRSQQRGRAVLQLSTSLLPLDEY